LATDSLEEIKSKMKGKQNRQAKEENLGLIEQERVKIVVEMK
jgi:hypothetical protein